MFRLATVAFVFVLLSPALAEAAPSFDCNKASSPSEKAICASPVLSALDAELSKRYRAFVNALPDSRKTDAGRMQRLWIRSRDTACIDGVRFHLEEAMTGETSINELSAMVQGDLPVRSDAPMERCLEAYYSTAIESLAKGALVSYVNFDAGQTSYSIDVAHLKRIEVGEVSEGLRDKQAYCWQDGSRMLRYRAITATGEQHLDDSVVNLCDGDALLLQARMYLLADGQPVFALVSYSSDSAGRCSSGDSLLLTFINLHPGGASGEQSEDAQISLANSVYTCGGGESHLLDWGVEDSKLVFTHWSDSSFYHWTTLPSVTNIIVDPVTLQITNDVFLDKDAYAFRGVPYASLHRKAISQGVLTVGTGYNTPSECTAVARGLHAYFSMKEFAAGEMINVSQAFFIANNVLMRDEYKADAKIMLPFARALLTYLEKIRERDDWARKLAAAAENYPDVNHHYFKSGDTPVTSPFVEAGFYTANDCLAQTWTPAAGIGLEDWIYLFWARRARDGTLEPMENVLRAATEWLADSDESAS